MYDDFDDTTKIKSSIDELYSLVKEYKSSTNFQNLIRFCAKFRRQAPYNAMLIHLQRPGAQYVLPPNKWAKYNRIVKTDSRPIIILRPFSPVAYLFEIADTMVMNGKEDLTPPEASAPYEGDPQKAVSKTTLEAICANLPLYGIYFDTMRTGIDYSGKLQVAGEKDPSVEFTRSKGKKGLVLPRSWRPYYTIKTREGATDSEKFAAIVHELAHLFCRHISCRYPKHFQIRKLSEPEEEFEAETVSWLVCQRLGVDNPSYRYLSEYLQMKCEIPNISIEEVLKATREIESMLKEKSVKSCYLYKNDPSFKTIVDQLNAKKPKLMVQDDLFTSNMN